MQRERVTIRPDTMESTRLTHRVFSSIPGERITLAVACRVPGVHGNEHLTRVFRPAVTSMMPGRVFWTIRYARACVPGGLRWHCPPVA